MEIENAVVEGQEPVTDVTEVVETPTEEPQVQEEVVQEFDLMKIIEEAIASTEAPISNTKPEEVIPNRPTSFENKPVTEKELEELKSGFENLVLEKDQALVEKEESLTAKEIQVQELTSQFESIQAEQIAAQKEIQTYRDFFSRLEATPIMGDIANAMAEGKEVDVPGALKAYAEQLKQATMAGSQTQVSVPAKPDKSTAQRLADLSNSPYIK